MKIQYIRLSLTLSLIFSTASWAIAETRFCGTPERDRQFVKRFFDEWKSGDINGLLSLTNLSGVPQEELGTIKISFEQILKSTPVEPVLESPLRDANKIYEHSGQKLQTNLTETGAISVKLTKNGKPTGQMKLPIGIVNENCMIGIMAPIDR